jgi:hypothetical protein
VRTGQNLKPNSTTYQGVLAMWGIIVFIALTVLSGLAVVFGFGADTRQPGRLWYPAGPDRKQ